MCVRAWVTACLIHLCHDALAWLAHLHTLAPTQTCAHTAGKSCWLDPPACSTLNPKPKTLNPQPSTLNGRQKLLARTVGMFKNKSLVVSVSHLPLSLCVRTNGHACSRLAACALKRLLVFALACACRLVCPRACVAGQTACGMRARVHIAVRIAWVVTAIVADRPLQICFDAWRRDTEERRRQKAAGEKPGENPDKKKCSCCAVS